MAILIAAGTVQAGGTEQDWANLGAYRSKNSSLGLPAVAERRIVFMGDSITEFWQGLEQGAPSPNRHVNRGISGQTTPQMLLRFRPDPTSATQARAADPAWHRRFPRPSPAPFPSAAATQE